jgi:hypothetical protein
MKLKFVTESTETADGDMIEAQTLDIKPKKNGTVAQQLAYIIIITNNFANQNQTWLNSFSFGGNVKKFFIEQMTTSAATRALLNQIAVNAFDFTAKNLDSRLANQFVLENPNNEITALALTTPIKYGIQFEGDKAWYEVDNAFDSLMKYDRNTNPISPSRWMQVSQIQQFSFKQNDNNAPALEKVKIISRHLYSFQYPLSVEPTDITGQVQRLNQSLIDKAIMSMSCNISATYEKAYLPFTFNSIVSSESIFELPTIPTIPMEMLAPKMTAFVVKSSTTITDYIDGMFRTNSNLNLLAETEIPIEASIDNFLQRDLTKDINSAIDNIYSFFNPYTKSTRFKISSNDSLENADSTIRAPKMGRGNYGWSVD